MNRVQANKKCGLRWVLSECMYSTNVGVLISISFSTPTHHPHSLCHCEEKIILTQAVGLKWSHSLGKTGRTLKDSPLSLFHCQNTEIQDHPHSPDSATLLYSSRGWLGKNPNMVTARRISAHLENKLHGTMITLSLTLSLFPSTTEQYNCVTS